MRGEEDVEEEVRVREGGRRMNIEQVAEGEEEGIAGRLAIQRHRRNGKDTMNWIVIRVVSIGCLTIILSNLFMFKALLTFGAYVEWAEHTLEDHSLGVRVGLGVSLHVCPLATRLGAPQAPSQPLGVHPIHERGTIPSFRG